MMLLFRRMLLVLPLSLVLLAQNAFGVAISVHSGWDLLETQAGTTFGGVPFIGVPLGSFDFGSPIGVQATGLTDTIVQRTATAFAPGLPGTASGIPLIMSALQLESTAPTDFGLGTDFYFMTLQSVRGGPASTGTMDITFASAAGGTFASSIDVFFDIRKGSLSGPIALSSDLIASQSGTAWSRNPPPNAVVIDGVNHNLNTFDVQADFWPVPYVENYPTGATHAVEAALYSVPEPSSIALLIGGVVGLIAMGCARCR